MSQPPTNPFSPPVADLDLVPAQQSMPSEELFRADRGSRLGAYILDLLLYVACIILGVVIRYFYLGRELLRGPHVVELTIIIYACMLPLAIYQWYRVTKTGQSLGKKWLGLRIVKMDGSPVNFVSGVLLRAWVPGAIGLVLQRVAPTGGSLNLSSIWGLADALFIFGPAARCIHDYMAGTKVVRASYRPTNVADPDAVDLERFG